MHRPRWAGWLAGVTWPAIAARTVLLTALGLLAWSILWSVTSPRAGYDTLWYELFGLRYAGADEATQISGSWAAFAEHADPARVASVEEVDGWPWAGRDDPSRARWIGLYQMRPLFPAIVAVTHPLIGDASAIAPSVVAVVGFTLAVGLMAPALIGWGGTTVLLLLSFANPHFARWLIHLTTDGLGLALWAAVLLAAARYVAGGGRGWLAALFVLTCLAAFNRQTGVVVTVGIGGLAALAVIAGQTAWRRLALAAVVSAVPLGIFSIYGSLSGLPSIVDMLQDVPTRHFADPDLPNIWRYPIRKFFEQTPVLLGRLMDPTLLVPLLLGSAGLILRRSWWAAVFLATLATLPILHYVHPVLTEADRAFAPAWFNVHVGLALLAGMAARRIWPTWDRSGTRPAQAGS